MVVTSLKQFVERILLPNNSIECYFWKECIGPSGELYLRDAIDSCMSGTQRNRRILVVPCFRKETETLISKGQHLSLFFMLLSVAVDDCLLTKTRQFLSRLLRHSPPLDTASFITAFEQWPRKICNDSYYSLHPASFEAARAFPYNGTGVEIIEQDSGLELGAIYKITPLEQTLDMQAWVTAIGFGLERLLISHLSLRSIWESKPFAELLGRHKDSKLVVAADQYRCDAFLTGKIKNQLLSRTLFF